MDTTNEWGANPEKYAAMREPFESVEKANQVVNEFLRALARLREQYRIAELVVQVQVYVQKEEGQVALHGGAGWGNQLQQAKLARRAADQEFAHLAHVLRAITDAYPDAAETMITDPIKD